MTKAEEKARNMIKQATTAQLVFRFELTEKIRNENIPIVRGWIMDELSARNANAFEAWIDSDDESPRKYFL